LILHAIIQVEDNMKLGGSFVRTSWLLGLVAVLLLLTGCTVYPPSQSASTGPSNGIHIQGDGNSVDWSDPTTMCAATLVADAQVATLGTPHWNTPDGARSASLDAQTILQNGYSIYTPVNFSYTHIHRDQRREPTATIEFDTIGGSVGPDSYSEDYPQLTPKGIYLLVMVPGIDPIAKAYTEKWLTVVAAFPIFKDMVVLQPRMVDHDGKVSKEQKDALLSQIVQQLANCK
jgi:hypothetical protein